MYKRRTKAKSWFKKAGKEKIDAFVKEAMLSDFDTEVCYLRKKKESYIKIAGVMHCDATTVARSVARIYDAIFLLVL